MDRLVARIKKPFIIAITVVLSIYMPAMTFAEDLQTIPEDTSTVLTEPTSDPIVPDTTIIPQEPTVTSTDAKPTEPSTNQTTLPSDSAVLTQQSPNTSTPAINTTTGPQEPNGDTSKTYYLNEVTGMWENDYYIWDPVTKKTTPKVEPSYSYNPTTGRWDTTEWYYNAASGKYEPNIISTSLPEGQNNPLADTSLLEGLTPQDLTLLRDLVSEAARNGVALDENNPDGGSLFDTFFNAYISNRIASVARTGDAGVVGNTLGGSATSGSALAMVNVLNLLQSSWNPESSNIATFVANIDGNVVGDLYIDPGQIEQNLTMASQKDNGSLYVVNDVNGRIDNSILLDAKSGDATVAKNTAAGNATTGTADAVANVINMINSNIAAGQSFVGVLNINGNFEGDILLPEGFLEEVLAGNQSVPTAVIDTSKLGNKELLAKFENNYAINNNVTTNAKTGQAGVTSNTSAGNAATGDASTNLTVLNLTGHQVIGSNVLLVFVNVLGKWVGAIVNAPSDATAAALGGGIIDNSLLPIAENTELTSTNNMEINNNILANATSGSANVDSNTSAGNASTGDASVNVSLLNILDSRLILSNWFGVLYINVLGNWWGSFGMDTAMGNPDPESASVGAGHTSSSSHNKVAKVFKFVSTEPQNYSIEPILEQTAPDNSSERQSQVSGVLSNTTPPTTNNDLAGNTATFNWWLPLSGIFLGLFLLWAIERTTSVIKERQAVY